MSDFVLRYPKAALWFDDWYSKVMPNWAGRIDDDADVEKQKFWCKICGKVFVKIELALWSGADDKVTAATAFEARKIGCPAFLIYGLVEVQDDGKQILRGAWLRRIDIPSTLRYCETPELELEMRDWWRDHVHGRPWDLALEDFI